jgi:L-rhamnose mutarotase
MIRKAFLMEIKPGMIAEYEKIHNPIWAELYEVVKAHGVHSFSIYHHKESSLLFGYVEIEDEEKFKQREQTEICQKWFQEMKKFLVSDAAGNSRKDDLREIFHID